MTSQFVQPVQALYCRRVSLKKSLVMLLCLLLFNLSLGCLSSWASVLMLTDNNCHSMPSTSVQQHKHLVEPESAAVIQDLSFNYTISHVTSLHSADNQHVHEMQHHCLASCSLFLQAPQLQPPSALRFSLQPAAQSCAHLATPLQGCLSNPERPPQLIS